MNDGEAYKEMPNWIAPVLVHALEIERIEHKPGVTVEELGVSHNAHLVHFILPDYAPMPVAVKDLPVNCGSGWWYVLIANQRLILSKDHFRCLAPL
jgi:hypothetical protein